MSVVTQAPAVPQQGPSLPGRQSVVLHGIDWESYEKFLEAVENRRIFLTYDRGDLEIMAPFFDHECWKHRVRLLLPFLCGEIGLEIQTIGMVTLRRQDLARGLEPDQGFYIKHAKKMAGLRKYLDLGKDPPPDLVLEVEGTRSALDRMSVYAALGVPEVWRFDGRAITIHNLRPDGPYEETSQSLSFPTLPMGDFAQFIQETEDLGEVALITAFLDWARLHLPLLVPGTGNGS